ncbi:hypothetical protein HYPSUDRAFT_208872 [Hypholoma sublateritium FD-334 SS-4]|uniref:F-box domain-containing protein n=1 Tax=Hypholoma sublateritium (strain FD-334 SS-4) TaxID=945553 RepID=A0A0D2P0R9_HYPSF|nr:hypothetical protein HYPSUDRAFT_208872 [Hypholoma sublateritium FD-334 SS-4]
MKTPVPFDILSYITNILVIESDNESLRAFSLLCKFMVPLCRQYLFSSVTLRSSKSTTPKGIGLTRFLSGSPDTTCRIKNLEFVVETPTSTSQDVLDILKIMLSQSTSLQSITFSSLGWPDWNVLHKPTKALLVSLIQLPTVTHLKLGAIKNFPLVALSFCSGLTDFSVSAYPYKAISPDSGQIVSRSKIPSPVSLYIRHFYSAIAILMRPPSPNVIDPIMDFSRLVDASFHICSENDASQMAELLKTAGRLQTLFIDYEEDHPLQLAGLGSSLAINAYQTLKSVKLSLLVDGDHHDPLYGLPLELQQLSGNNVLEELKVDVLVSVDKPCPTDSDDWSDLDAVLTKQGAFPMLRRVTLNLLWSSCDRDEEEVEALLDSLTRDRFPRLLQNSAIHFLFNAEHDYLD